MHKCKAKVVVLGSKLCYSGAPATGKTLLCQVYSGKNSFTGDYNMTQGGQVYSKIIPIPKSNKDVELFLFDIAGQQYYDSIATVLMKNPDLVMLIYDSTDQETFKASIQWLDKLKKVNGGKSFPGVFVGTKCQHKNAKEIPSQKGAEMAKRLKLDFFEVSTALQQNIDQPFIKLAEKALQLGSYSIN